MGTLKISGFGYNAEAYDAATGMINLRARQYEPTISRFEQKDAYSGIRRISLSINAYLFVINAPTMFIDASGNSWAQNALALGKGPISQQAYDTFVALEQVKQVEKIYNWLNPSRTILGKTRSTSPQKVDVISDVKSAAQKAANIQDGVALEIFMEYLEQYGQPEDKTIEVFNSLKQDLSMTDSPMEKAKIYRTYCEYYLHRDEMNKRTVDKLELMRDRLELYRDSKGSDEGRRILGSIRDDILKGLWSDIDLYPPQIRDLIKQYVVDIEIDNQPLYEARVKKRYENDIYNIYSEFVDKLALYVDQYDKEALFASTEIELEKSETVTFLYGSNPFLDGTIGVKAGQNFDFDSRNANEMNAEMWKEFVGFLFEFTDYSNNKVIYGTEYRKINPNYPKGSSIKYVIRNGKKTMYLDCWGVIKLGYTMYLDPVFYKEHSDNEKRTIGTVSNIYASIDSSHKGEVRRDENGAYILKGSSDDKDKALGEAQILFIERDDDKEGVDHVGIYFQSISIPHKDGSVEILHDVFFSMEGVKNGMTMVSFNDYYNKHKGDIYWGDQIY